MERDDERCEWEEMERRDDEGIPSPIPTPLFVRASVNRKYVHIIPS